MSDPVDLVTRFVVAVEKIASALSAGKAAPAAAAGASAGAAGANKAATTPADKAAAEKAAKAAAEKAAAAKAAEKAAAGKGKPADSKAASTKAPGGKHTLDDVRAIIREVATNAALGKTEAKTILDEEGGVTNVADLKPDNYDAVYEACQVALNNAGKSGDEATEEDDLMGV